MALEAGDDGLVFYRALAQHYRQALRPGGALVDVYKRQQYYFFLPLLVVLALVAVVFVIIMTNAEPVSYTHLKGEIPGVKKASW